MKKETVTAIVFGIILGGILAVILIVKNRETKLAQNKTIAPTEKTIRPSTTGNVNLQQLEIISPNDRSIVNKNSITIKVKAIKDSLVVMQSPIKDLVFRTDKDQFSVDWPLVFGENVIQITIYPKDIKLRSQEKELKIYYLDEQL